MSKACSPNRNEAPRTLAISSGKGGVGKTFLSVHLAARAARHGSQVLLMDADLGLANVDVMLGITATGSIEQVLDGDAQLRDILVTDIRGFDVMPGGSGLHQLTRLSADRQIILLDHMNALAENYDLILIDTPAGIGENVLYFSSCAGTVLIMLTPDPTSLTDAYALIKVMSRQRGVDRFLIVVNQATGAMAQIVFRRLLAVADRYLDVVLEFAGCMSDCTEVREAIRAQKLLQEYADCTRTDEMNTLLDAILCQSAASRRDGMQLFWQRALKSSLHSRESGSTGKAI